jgi:hypothetical protein
MPEPFSAAGSTGNQTPAWHADNESFREPSVARHTLFIVHGMGRHPDGWSKDPWTKLKEVSKRYRFFQDQNLEDLVEPIPITYDNHIVAALRRWEQLGSEFATFAKQNELRIAGSLDWLEGIGADDSFLLSNVADVLIYHLFKLEQGRIQDSVKLQFARRIQQLRDQATAEFSVLAHSLGTSVMHDALAELGSAETIDGKVNTFRAGNFSFRSIHTIANVSRLLQSEPQAYRSIIRPGDRDSTSSYCQRMHSYRHELDPFLLPKPFEPIGWPPEFTSATVRHYHDWNIHGFEHYLENPRVHIPILAAVTRASAIGPIERGKAVDAHAQWGGRLKDVARLQQKIAELAALGRTIQEEDSLADAYAKIVDMWGVIGEIKAIVETDSGGN